MGGNNLMTLMMLGGGEMMPMDDMMSMMMMRRMFSGGMGGGMGSGMASPGASIKSENLPSRFVCGVCKTEQSPWICVKCGRIHCGRYVNGHAKLHHEEATNHAVCMDCDNLAVFCYKCDEFVINDTAPGHLEKLRQQLKSISSAQARMRQKSRRRCSTDSQENEKATKKSRRMTV